MCASRLKIAKSNSDCCTVKNPGSQEMKKTVSSKMLTVIHFDVRPTVYVNIKCIQWE